MKNAFLIDLMPKDPSAREEAEALLRMMTVLTMIVLALWVAVSLVQHGALAGFWEVAGYYGLPAFTISLLGYLNARADFAYVSSSTTLAAGIVVFQAAFTGLLHAYGSTSTPIAGLYIIIVVTFTVFFSGHAGAVATLAAILFYNVLIYAEQVGWLAYAPFRPTKQLVGKDPQLAGSTSTAVTFIIVSAYAISLYVYSVLSRRRDELRRSNEDLAAANEKLVALDAMKSRFLSVVSHDLRTPITSIKAFGELLHEDVDGESQQFAHTIVTEADRLNRMVTDLLDLDKMEAGKMEWNLRVQDVRPVLRNAARVFRAAAADKKITLAEEYADDLPALNIDADRIAQLVANLLSNAVKFTPDGGTVTLRAGLNGADDAVHIDVADTGPGIPPDALDTIFDRFTQTGSGKQAGGGTGLGLAIAKEVATAHGGDLTVASALGEGATFTVIVPHPE